jgi:hypothetical protein
MSAALEQLEAIKATDAVVDEVEEVQARFNTVVGDLIARGLARHHPKIEDPEQLTLDDWLMMLKEVERNGMWLLRRLAIMEYEVGSKRGRVK